MDSKKKWGHNGRVKMRVGVGGNGKEEDAK